MTIEDALAEPDMQGSRLSDFAKNVPVRGPMKRSYGVPKLVVKGLKQAGVYTGLNTRRVRDLTPRQKGILGVVLDFTRPKEERRRIGLDNEEEKG